ncbi:MAG TPA: PEGA domain-containing protein [Planctomycetaceae bacterium]|nr:PEGA domain-containing protein [Planctomycetaceae bacterium]
MVAWNRQIARCALAAAVAGCLLSTGCVSRRMTICSDPPGALVMLEGREIGYTPVSVDFTYYGTREFTLIKDGYETLTVNQPVAKPWYQQPVVEFFADNFTPGHVTDRHQFRYAMQPQRLIPNDVLLQRGEMLRGEARVGR